MGEGVLVAYPKTSALVLVGNKTLTIKASTYGQSHHYKYMSDVSFNKIEDGELLKWEKPGIKLVGILKSYKEQKTAMGQGHVYEVQTKDEIVPFFAPSLLHKKLQNVGLGNLVKIEYIKKTKTGAGTDLKHFDVGYTAPTEANLKSLGLDIFDKKVSDDEISADDVDMN